MRKDQTATTTAAMQETADSKKDFSSLLRKYETAYRNNSADLADVLQEIGTAVAYSVLRKCIDVSQNPQLTEVKRSIARDTNTIKNIKYSSEHAFETVYTQDGDRETRTKDSDYRYAYTKLAGQTLGDGLDLVNTAIASLLEETKKADTAQDNFLEIPYSVRRLKKKVWIKLEDSANGWETVETTPIQETYKAVRREIEHSRAMSTDPRNGYTYLEEMAQDTETDSETVVYRRLSKYADLGGYATDYNGAFTFYSADSSTVESTDTIIDSLELTAKQSRVLQLRMSGHGEKAIATYLGVSKTAVQKTLKAIQKKAIVNELLDTTKYE